MSEFRDLYREGYEADPEGFTRRSMEWSDEITRHQCESQRRAQRDIAVAFKGRQPFVRRTVQILTQDLRRALRWP